MTKAAQWKVSYCSESFMKQSSHLVLVLKTETKDDLFTSNINKFAIQTCKMSVRSWCSFSVVGIGIEKGLITTSCLPTLVY